VGGHHDENIGVVGRQVFYVPGSRLGSVRIASGICGYFILHSSLQTTVVARAIPLTRELESDIDFVAWVTYLLPKPL
jgi:hypothetical protein